MEIRDNQVIKSRDEKTKDYKFQRKLEISIKKWSDLKLKEIPMIFKKIGVQEKDYTVKLLEETAISMRLSIKPLGKQDRYEVQIRKDTNCKSACILTISKNGEKAGNYQIRKIVNITEI